MYKTKVDKARVEECTLSSPLAGLLRQVVAKVYSAICPLVEPLIIINNTHTAKSILMSIKAWL
jgi:hypothetical protein